MKKVISLMLTIALMVTLLTGCLSTGATTAAPASPQLPAKPLLLRPQAKRLKLNSSNTSEKLSRLLTR